MTNRAKPALIVGLCVSGALTPRCQAFVAEYEPDLEAVSNTVDVQALCAAESQFAFPVDLESDEREPTLTDYYRVANPAIGERLEAVALALHDGKHQLGATYIWGAAGIGKSYVTDSSFESFEETERCEIDLRDLFTGPTASLGFETASTPDLATTDSAMVFNELPALASPRDFDVMTLLDAGGCFDGGILRPLVILDGIDELHDDTARAILRGLDGLLVDNDGSAPGFLHIVVAGRPDGFVPWLGDPARVEVAGIGTFELVAPKYDSAADIEFRVIEYLDYVEELAALEARDGVDAYVARVESALQTYPFLTYTLSNLAWGNVVIQHTTPGRNETEESLKAGIFDDMLTRNAESHGRPGAGSPYDATYRRLLEDIAARYADVDEFGTFEVRSTDEMLVEDDDGSPLGAVRVRDVLSHGGLTVPDSPTASTMRARFEPHWLHAHLIEQRNRRFDSGYTYRGCE